MIPCADMTDRGLAPVVEAVLRRAALRPGQRVLYLLAGPAGGAALAARQVTPGGRVVALVAPAPAGASTAAVHAMLATTDVTAVVGRGDRLPLARAAVDAVLAPLGLPWIPDRAAVAREVARVLRPGGRLVAAVWGPPRWSEAALFQQVVASFAPPSEPGAGPGGLWDASPFLAQLREAGLAAALESQRLTLSFPDVASAWVALGGAAMPPGPAEQAARARDAVRARFWPGGDGPRRFENLLLVIVAERPAGP
jgi:SAM-dependent methyltransferase